MDGTLIRLQQQYVVVVYIYVDTYLIPEKSKKCGGNDDTSITYLYVMYKLPDSRYPLTSRGSRKEDMVVRTYKDDPIYRSELFASYRTYAEAVLCLFTHTCTRQTCPCR